MLIRGEVEYYDPVQKEFHIIAPYDDVFDVAKKQYSECEIRLDDERSITSAQRRKARAIIAEICNWSGYEIQKEFNQVHQILKAYFCSEYNMNWFSLSDTDTTTARKYITYLIDFCLKNDIPCMDTLLNYTDDVNAYLYSCLMHRRCVICGKPADVHHVDKIGMGVDRTKTEHVGRLAMALCRCHHEQVHKIGQTEFNKIYHVYPIMLDNDLVKHLKL